MKKTAKVRLFYSQNLSNQNDIFLNDDATHYLLNVLRMSCGEELKVFDGQSGEYLAEIVACNKKSCQLKLLEKCGDFVQSPDLWLMFAPVKKDKTDFILAGATELGVRKIIPTITQRTISDKIRKERYTAQVIEASEQSRRTDVPIVEEPVGLEKILKAWDPERTLYYMDETGHGEDILQAFTQTPHNIKAAILVGPEGGFAETELEELRKCSFAKGVSLGKRILRAETAVMASLSCWQAICGDWKK